MVSSVDPEDPGAPIRVLIGNLSGIMAQIVVQLVQQQPDMVVVGPVQGQVELLEAAGSGADVLIMGAQQLHPPPGICSHLLAEFPHLRILVLAISGDAAVLHWMGLRRRRLTKVTKATLHSTIRRAYAMNPTI